MKAAHGEIANEEARIRELVEEMASALHARDAIG